MTTPKQPLCETTIPPSASSPLWEDRVGRITGTDEEGRPVVDFEGSSVGPRSALSTVPLQGKLLDEAIAARQHVKLRFHDGDIRRPVIVGISREAPRSSRAEGPLGSVGAGFEIEEDSDGVILRVGKASLRLMRDGKVFLKGTYVETCAEGLNRIKGGTVDIG